MKNFLRNVEGSRINSAEALNGTQSGKKRKDNVAIYGTKVGGKVKEMSRRSVLQDKSGDESEGNVS